MMLLNVVAGVTQPLDTYLSKPNINKLILVPNQEEADYLLGHLLMIGIDNVCIKVIGRNESYRYVRGTRKPHVPINYFTNMLRGYNDSGAINIYFQDSCYL